MEPMHSYNKEIRQSETLRIVKSTSTEHLKQIAKHLNDYGIIEESDSFVLQVLEFWTIECDKHLETCGYTGGRLKPASEYCDGIGNCCVLYDTKKYAEYDERLSCPKQYMRSRAL